jgi:hypothetical protein
MLTARSIQQVFKPGYRFLPSFAAPSLTPTHRSYHSDFTDEFANDPHRPIKTFEALRARVADAASVRRGLSADVPDAAPNATAAAQRGVGHAATWVALARAAVDSAQAAVAQTQHWVSCLIGDVADARIAASCYRRDETLATAVRRYERRLEKEKASLTHREARLTWYETQLKHAEAGLATARAAAEAQRAFDLRASFPRVAPDVALQQLGALAQSKRFEVPTQTLEALKQHARTFRDVFGRSGYYSTFPGLAVAATPGAGKTALLRYLQQTADTVRYGADLQADTNWLAKGWNATRSDVSDKAQSVPALRHVFVGYATFSQESDTSFDPSLDTAEMIKCRCAWRILYDAGLAPDWSLSYDPAFNSSVRIGIDEAAAMLRLTIGAAKGCTPDEVAIVFLIDDVTNIPDGPRAVLLDSVAGCRRLFSIVTGLSLFGVTQRGHKGLRPTAALQLLPLVALPRELAAEVANDARVDRSRRLELLGYIGAAGGHPRTLARIVDAMKDPRHKVSLPVPGNADQLACVWDMFADSMLGHLSVDARKLATAPENEPHRRLLDLNFLRQHPEASDDDAVLPRIVLTVAPSALFLAEDPVWTQQLLTGEGFPYDAVVAVRTLMQATDGIAEKWGLAFTGMLHLTAQCVLHARLKQVATLLPGQEQDLPASVPFKDLVPGAIIGCECADLRYVVRDEFAHTVDRALTHADFQKLRDVSCLHSEAPDQAAIGSAFAAECGDEAVVVAAHHEFHGGASEQQVDKWFDAAAKFMGGHAEGDKFRVLLCLSGLPQEARDTIKTRAANRDDRLSRSIIIDPASAPQIFERFGLWTFVEALKYC